MTHHPGHGGFGLALFVAAIAFAFGANVARVFVGGALLIALGAFAYVMGRIVMGTI